MPKWVAACPLCKRSFTHTQLDSSSIVDPSRHPPQIPRPNIARDGQTLKCPNCNRELIVKSCDLTYSYL
jgi:hypothetical protein